MWPVFALLQRSIDTLISHAISSLRFSQCLGSSGRLCAVVTLLWSWFLCPTVLFCLGLPPSPEFSLVWTLLARWSQFYLHLHLVDVTESLLLWMYSMCYCSTWMAISTVQRSKKIAELQTHTILHVLHILHMASITLTMVWLNFILFILNRFFFQFAVKFKLTVKDVHISGLMAVQSVATCYIYIYIYSICLK